MMDEPFDPEPWEGDESEMEYLYGFPLVSNPHDFAPDYQCCTPAEIAAWESDCKLWDAQPDAVPNPREGSGWYGDADGKPTMHMLTTRWGIGTNFFRPGAPDGPRFHHPGMDLP